MCSHQDWESLRRRFQDVVEEGELREFVADAVSRVEAFVEEAQEPRLCSRGRGLGSGMRPAIPDRVGRLAEARDDASRVLVVPRTST